MPQLMVRAALTLAAVTSTLAGLAACGPSDVDPVDAAIFYDRDLTDRVIDFRDTAIADGDLTDRPMRDGPVSCPNDGLEPNDIREMATQMQAMDFTVSQVGICTNGDRDFYSVFLDAGQRMVFTLRFTHYDGDLVLDLLSFDGSLLSRSDFSSFASGEESVLATSSAAQTKFLVRVTSKRFDDRVPYVLDFNLN